MYICRKYVIYVRIYMQCMPIYVNCVSYMSTYMFTYMTTMDNIRAQRISNKNSLGDEIANVNFFTTSHM